MSKPRLMAVVGAMLAALLISAVALAQTPPQTFFGYSGDTTVDGEAADGATVSAWAGGEEVGSATLDASGEWSIEVEAGTMGVSFSVNGIAADGSYDAEVGGNTRVTLAVSTPVEEPEGDLEGDEDAVAGDEDAMPVDDDAMPVDDDAMPVDDDAMPVDDDAMPVDDDAMPVDDDAMPVDDDAMPVDDDAMPVDDDAMPVDDDAMPVDDDAMEGDDDAMEGDDDAMDGDEDATDGDEDAADGDSEFPVGGTGGLADSSGSNSWAFGLAGALALTALLGGVAIRRRVQS